MSDKKYIYVILPRVVDTPKGLIEQVPGRQIAQACHVTSKLRHELGLNQQELVGKPKKSVPIYEDITTIILDARNEKEMHHVATLLVHQGHAPVYFHDSNLGVYGSEFQLTAMAVYAYPDSVFGILDYLPLWRP